MLDNWRDRALSILLGTLLGMLAQGWYNSRGVNERLALVEYRLGQVEIAIKARTVAALPMQQSWRN